MSNQMIANRYVLVQPIGEGGMASVHLAVDTILKREVAIKILRGDLAKDPVSLLRFQREANATTQLSHPNIVEVYDVGEDEGRYYIVMEYVKGKTLKDLISQRGALNKEEAVNIMRQLVSAIAVAHKNGIIHRDIKSQNVLIKDDGTVKLSDFGIALAQDAVQLTQTDVVLGSVHYLAPELAKGESATVLSDIYSLGIVFYEMLIGDVPYHAEAPVQVALKHMREEIPSVREFNGSLPQSIENIVIKATAKNKANRYPSADIMYEDLVTCLDAGRTKEDKVIFSQENDNTISLGKQGKKETGRKVGNVLVTVFGIAGLGALAALAVGFIMMLNGGIGFGPAKLVKVPDVVGLSIEEATVLLQEEGLLVSTNFKYEITLDIEKNCVAATSPSAFSEVKEGTTIQLTISEGKYYTMQNFVGKNIDEALRELGDYNFKIKYNYVIDKEKDVGTILKQSVEEGTLLHPTQLQTITFDVTKNAEIYIGTQYEGMNYKEARDKLKEEGATVELVKLDIPQEEYEVEVEVEDKDNPIYDEEGNIIGYNMKTVTKKKKRDKDVERNVVVKFNVEFGEYYTQTKKSKLKLYYYPES